MNYTEKNKLLDKISLIGLMAIFVKIFLYAVDHCFTKRFDIAARMPIALVILSVIFLAIAAGLFIYAKNSNKKDVKIYAIEFLVLAVVSLVLVYWYYPRFYGLQTGLLHKLDHRMLWIVALVYYLGRIVYSCFKAYQNSNERKLKKKRA